MFVFSSVYEADIGPHVFPTEKYRLTRDRLRDFVKVPIEAFVEPVLGDRTVLSLVHDPSYLNDLENLKNTPAAVSSELPLTREIVEWFELAVFGSITATRLALEHGAAMHLGGGFHHAFADHAEGFCYLNDIAVAARVALGDGTDDADFQNITVVDLDVHQGNGTARIFQNETRVFTFSMHQENNYPIKERSDLDFGVRDGIEDEEYLEQLNQGLETAVLSRRPNLVYYVAGADPYKEDALGGLNLSLEGLKERDRRVFSACKEIGAKAVVLLAGGYAADLSDTIRIHAQTGQELLRLWPY